MDQICEFGKKHGFPFTVSVFGDTANSGTVLGENPVRANYTGQPISGPNTRTSAQWFSPAAFATPAAFAFGNVGRNTIYGPGMQSLDMAVVREFALSEGFRFQFRAEFFNALNKEGTRISLPFGRSSAKNMDTSALVPLQCALTCLAPRYSRVACSS